MVTLGILADTHIPDRTQSLNPYLLSRFEAEQVQAILHAGDVCIQRVLDELREIAPVYAVRGNRDLWALRKLPNALELEFEGVQVGLTHGHGSLTNYLIDKARFFLEGLREQHFVNRVGDLFPKAAVVIFGHTHIPANRYVGGKLIFNPGSACCPNPVVHVPTAGLLHIGPGDSLRGEIFSLEQSDSQKVKDKLGHSSGSI